jgi:hypothetical protein
LLGGSPRREVSTSSLTPEDFGVSFESFLVESPGLPVVLNSLAPYDHPIVHLAIEHELAHEGRSAQMVGVAGQAGFGGKSLADLIAGQHGYVGAPTEGPVQYADAQG